VHGIRCTNCVYFGSAEALAKGLQVLVYVAMWVGEHACLRGHVGRGARLSTWPCGSGSTLVYVAMWVGEHASGVCPDASESANASCRLRAAGDARAQESEAVGGAKRATELGRVGAEGLGIRAASRVACGAMG